MKRTPRIRITISKFDNKNNIFLSTRVTEFGATVQFGVSKIEPELENQTEPCKFGSVVIFMKFGLFGPDRIDPK